MEAPEKKKVSWNIPFQHFLLKLCSRFILKVGEYSSFLLTQFCSHFWSGSYWRTQLTYVLSKLYTLYMFYSLLIIALCFVSWIVFCTTFHTLHRKHYFWKVRCYCRVGSSSGVAHSRDSRSHPLSNYQTFLFSHCNSIHFPEPRTCHVHPVAISFTELSLVHSFLNVIETSLLGLLTRIFLSRSSYVHLVHCTFPAMVFLRFMIYRDIARPWSPSVL